MFLPRRSKLVALTLFFVAVFSAFAWSQEKPPGSFRVDVVGRSSSSTWSRFSERP